MAKIIVIKMGGALVKEPHLLFLANMKQLQKNGYGIVLVHGGGVEIDEFSEKLAVPKTKVDGIRVTNQDSMNLVSMVLNGLVNKRLTSYFQHNGIEAVGISGVDNGILQGKLLEPNIYGRVGQVEHVKTALLQALIEKHLLVFSPVGVGEDGEIININGDVAAGALAKALQAEKLILATDVRGVLKEGVLQEQLTAEDVEKLLEEKVITGGMIPKVVSALDALNSGMKEVMITHGHQPFQTKEGKWSGTTIVKEVKTHVV